MTRPGRLQAPPLGDVLLAAALTAGSLPLLWIVGPTDVGLPGYAGPSLAAGLLSSAMTVPVAWRRAYPLTVLAVVGLATVVASAWPIPYVGLGLIVAVYTVAAHRPRREAVLALVGVTVLMVVAMVLADALRFLAGNAVVFSTAWLFGDWRRLQLARAEELRRRSRELVRARRERSRLAVGRERERIAAELRDVLAHGVAEMLTQTQAAARLLDRDAPRAAEALGTVERSGSACLTELRRLVGLLRREEADTVTGSERVGDDTAPGAASDDGPYAPGASADLGRWHLVSGEGVDRFRRRVQRLPVLVQDLALVALLLIVELPLQWLRPEGPVAADFGGPSVGSVLLVLALGGVLVWRRRAPQLVLAATLVLSVGVVAASVPVQLFAPLVALYTVGAHRPRRTSVPWLAGMLVLTALVLTVHGSPQLLPGQIAVVVVVWLLGDWQRVRRGYEQQLEHRTRELEEARTREAELAVAEERARIARELHDVVAHTVGVMIVQARAARAMATRDPKRAAEAVEHVLTAGRESLRWLREVVDRLGEDPQGYAPQPDLGDLDELVAGFLAAGLEVTLDVQGAPAPGSPGPVSRGVSLSAYRIVQESLTNVLKHAGATRAIVTLRYGDRLEVEVVDDGCGPDRDGERSGVDEGGNGLVGMAERARLVGGELETGSRLGGGFRVRARLPMTDHAPAEAAP